MDNVSDVSGTLAAFREIDAELQRLNIGLFNAGPASSAEAIAIVPDIVAIGPRISTSRLPSQILWTHPPQKPSRVPSLAFRSARLVGEGNFQFCCSFNVPPGIPFFPAAYHASGQPTCFGIGCETSAVVADALPQWQPGGGQSALLTASFIKEFTPIEAISAQLASQHGLVYSGIDASIAPLGTAPPLSERLRFRRPRPIWREWYARLVTVTSAVKALRDRTASGLTICGYTGLMLPPCRGGGLARRATEGGYRIHDLHTLPSAALASIRRR